MWYELEWTDANSCARIRKTYIEAKDLVDALKKAVDRTTLQELTDSCHLTRVAKPPLMYFRK